MVDLETQLDNDSLAAVIGVNKVDKSRSTMDIYISVHSWIDYIWVTCSQIGAAAYLKDYIAHKENPLSL